MISRQSTTRMVLPKERAQYMAVHQSIELHQARCVKCKKIIADDSTPIESAGLKPEDIRSIRIKCKNCGTLNFVSHK